MNGGQTFNISGGENSNANFGNTYNNQGAYNDYRSGPVRHEYGDRYTYHTTNRNRHYDNSTNFNGNYYGPATNYYGPVNNVGTAENVISGDFVNRDKIYNQDALPRPAAPARPRYDEYSTSPPQHEGFPQQRGPANPDNYAGGYHAPSSHYHGTVNNVGSAQNANFGNNYGTINQGTTTQVGGGQSPPSSPPAGPYNQGPYGPRPGPVPNDQDFTVSSTAIPQHEGFPQQRGPATPDPPRRVPSDPAMLERNQAWQQQQRPQPSAFPPAGPQGYPHHPPQDPNFRPAQGSFPPPPQQSQRFQPQQPSQQRQGSEQWPGQNAYKQGMEHLKQSKPSGWDTNNTGSSDSSSSDESELDRYPRRKRDPRSKPISEGPSRVNNVVATAAGGARLTTNYGAAQAAPPPVPPQGPVFNQGPQYAASPAVPPSRGRTPQPEQYPPPRGDPSPASRRSPSPQPTPLQQRSQSAPSPPPAPTPASAPAPAPAPANSSPQDKKKKKHRNPFTVMFSSKKK